MAYGSPLVPKRSVPLTPRRRRPKKRKGGLKDLFKFLYRPPGIDPNNPPNIMPAGVPSGRRRYPPPRPKRPAPRAPNPRQQKRLSQRMSRISTR